MDDTAGIVSVPPLHKNSCFKAYRALKNSDCEISGNWGWLRFPFCQFYDELKLVSFYVIQLNWLLNLQSNV